MTATPTVPQASRTPYLDGSYAPVANEVTALDLKVTGEIPKDLVGTWQAQREGTMLELHANSTYDIYYAEGLTQGRWFLRHHRILELSSYSKGEKKPYILWSIVIVGGRQRTSKTDSSSDSGSATNPPPALQAGNYASTRSSHKAEPANVIVAFAVCAFLAGLDGPRRLRPALADAPWPRGS